MVKPQKQMADRDAYSIKEFCQRHNLSRGTYYNMRREGLAPVEVRVFTRVLITKEAAEAWRRVMSQPKEE